MRMSDWSADVCSSDLARGRHTVERADDRLAFVVLELDADVALVGFLLQLVATNVAFLLQHLEHVHTQLRGRAVDRRLVRLLAVADTGQHIAKGIGKSHARILLTSST